MYRIVKRFSFEAAHQLDRCYSAECRDSVHGHSYTFEVYLASRCLNGDQMVIDLGAVKEFCKGLRDEWDHALILSKTTAAKYADTPSRKIVALPAQPTAEVMAKILFDRINEQVRQTPASNGLYLERVRVWETATGYAEYQADRMVPNGTPSE